jgi:hypothetical protein
LKKLNEKKERIKTMVCFLPLILVFACEFFSTLFERKRERKVLLHICANAKSPHKIQIRSNFD